MHFHEIKQRLTTEPVASHQKDAAILLPLVQIENQVHILFQVRALSLNAQPGETCFPGGRIDQADSTPKDAAIREFTEELGIDPSLLSILAALPKIESPRKGLIYPFVAEVYSLDTIQPNPEEVDDWFTIPLDYLLHTEPTTGYITITIEPGENFPINQIANKRAYERKTYQMPEYFYTYNNRIVWGLTARVLNSFLQHLKQQ
ncbi:Nudix hydrolase YeaB [Bacillus sp. JCM 19046]|uniref:8-oxo-dGTP pyrophosphatase MutT (NUDIX family) n=1 Tax=Shouchella xiaoxiensis TaxID=766895 RepID=A0ABS2SRA0_9BACI|nr:8-oxo-dGTP pyrophosphatase MutT (NUDIX family) [Shouchella xiaoxiensis]GAF12339.1 Nudix hydrolase YeaB [Bacillus sp. JCM 19045]GAF20202.1 Nudix hydrolase YeaB [Bacillus sp. JCM 19046]